MDKRIKRRLRGVAVFLVFLAVAVTIMEYRHISSKDGVGDAYFKPSMNEFKNLKWLNKAIFDMGVTDAKAAQYTMQEIMSSAEKTIRMEKKDAYAVYTFSVPRSEFASLREKLSKIGRIGYENETVDTSLVNLNPQTEVSSLASYEKDLAEMEGIRIPSEADLRRKEHIRSMINRTRVNLENLKTADSYLVYVTTKPVVKGSGVVTLTRELGLIFGKWLAIFFMALVLIYYGTKLLMYLLSLMGVRGLGAGGVGGSYQYGGYTSYANRYYSRGAYGGARRKVKRIYKDKKSQDEDSKEQ